MIETVDPQKAGMSTERLQRITDHFQQKYIDTGKISGALTLVARRNQVVHFQPQGHLEIEQQRDIQRDTIFRIYSMTKPITSVAIMMLYEQAKFQLDEPVHKYIPEWKNLGVFKSGRYPQFMTTPPERPMTIRDLLSHMSGLTYGFMQTTNVDSAYRRLNIGGNATLKEMIEMLAELPLEFSPGTAWNYSVSTDVLGYLVQVIADQSFDEYLKEKVFEPLGMEDTGFGIPDDKLDRFACNYEVQPGKPPSLADAPENSTYRGEQAFFSGGGGLVSTVEDYYRFTAMLLNGGEFDGARLLGRKTIELMASNHLPNGGDLSNLAKAGMFSETGYAGMGFGLGFSVMMDPAKAQVAGTPGEYAWGGAASTAFWIDPAEELILIFMTQLMPSSYYPFRRELRALVYSSITD
ncbi:MAG: serine hydrolase domain-containing protein [Pseudomonadota bacterium]